MLVVVEDGGGLANRLFVFANVIVTGLATGHRVVNPAFRHWAGSFEGTEGDHLSFFPRRTRAYFGGRLPARIAASLSYRSCSFLAVSRGIGAASALSLKWPQHCDLDDPLVIADFQRRHLVLLKGWLFRNRSGVGRYQIELRSFFRPVPTIRDQANRVVEAARQHAEILVGVHVRHRDYRNFMGGKYFYPFTTYVALMQAVASMHADKKLAFLVCSDAAHDASLADDLKVTVSTMSPVHDLWALSRCDLLMGPPSTFSAWASFLGEVPLWKIDDPKRNPEPGFFHVSTPIPSLPAETS